MHKTWNGLYRKKAPAGCMVAMLGMHFVWNSCIPCLILVLFASVAVQWTWFAAGLLPDMQRISWRCSGHWPHIQMTDKERRITGMKQWSMMMYIFWGILHMTGTKTFFKCSKNILSVAHALHFHFTLYLSVTNMVMSSNWLLIVLYMSSNCAVIVRFMRSNHQSR